VSAAEPASSLPPIAVLGAGSWGTALAIQFARAGRPTRLWGRDPAQLALLARERCNNRYLPGAAFPESLEVFSDPGAALDTLAAAAGNVAADAAPPVLLDVLLAVPSHGLRKLLGELQPRLHAGMRLSWATKGFELDTGLLPHQVARAVLGDALPMAVLSGPTFAKEVGAGLPTAMTVASGNEAFATAIALSLSSSNFRAYTSTDIIGVEVGGAVKNVLAVGAGLSDGLGFGANTRIALITRGLVEMTRLGVALGAQRETFMGLAGLGDLVLTCTDNLSRNRRFGLALASGCTAQAALTQIGQVVEGYVAARAVHAVAQRAGVSMPICEGIHQLLYAGAAPADVVKALMTRPIKAETD
jgi:glycerol-3-phosphate dehydrogenase (NAD(P)+)